MYSISHVVAAAAALRLDEEQLIAALDRAAIQQERASRRANDGAVYYQPVTPEYSLWQAVKEGFVSKLVFRLADEE